MSSLAIRLLDAAPSPSIVRAVERAISDLRRSVPVLITEGLFAALVLPAETITETGLQAMRRLGGRLHLVAGSDARVLPVPDRASAQWLNAKAEEPTGPHTAASALDLAAVALVKHARLLPVALVATVAGDPAVLARTEALLSLETATVFGFKPALVEGLTRVSEARVPVKAVEDCRIVAFRPADGDDEHLAIVIGSPDPALPVLTRLHSSCITGDVLGSLRCDCGDQLQGAIAAMAEAGGGVVLYLNQEGRGIGIANKLRAYRIQDTGVDTVEANLQLGFLADERDFGIAAAMLRDLGFGAVRLMTNNPEKLSELTRHGITVSEHVPHRMVANQHNQAYLDAKRERSGHML